MVKLGVLGGAGLLGATCAFCIARENLAGQIILSDLKENIAKSHAMDIGQAVCEKSDTEIITGTLEDLSGCDYIINTVGIPEIKTASRDEYLGGNIAILKQLAVTIKSWGTSPVIISATNPIDVLNYMLHKLTGLPASNFVGFSRNDTLRFIWSASAETGISARDLTALVIGEHGDGQVPLFSTLKKTDGQTLKLSDSQRSKILARTGSWFSDYQSLDAGRSSGWTSGAGLTEILRLILKDGESVCPCSVIPNGEYGLSDLSIGLPVRLGRCGVSEIVSVGLSDDEKRRLETAALKIKGLIKLAESM